MIASVSGEEQSFIETGQPQRCHLAYRHELKRVQVKADIGITTLWHRQGNNLINCTEISLMNSYVVISMRSNSRMSFSFLMGQHSCSFGSAPIFFLFFFLPPLSFLVLAPSLALCAWPGVHVHTHARASGQAGSAPHPLPRACLGRRAGQSPLAKVATLKSMPDQKEIVGWFLYESCIFFL